MWRLACRRLSSVPAPEPLWRKAQHVYSPTVSRRGLDREEFRVRVGDEVNGFVCESVTLVPEMEMTQAVFRHKNTGAMAVHIDAADMDNCFA